MWFIHITDTHIGMKGDSDNDNFELLVNNVFENIKPEFVVNTGDVVDGSNCENNDDCERSTTDEAIQCSNNCGNSCSISWELAINPCSTQILSCLLSCWSKLEIVFGPYAEEWEEYLRIIDSNQSFKSVYYDLPGNHNRYMDPNWSAYYLWSVRGKESSPTGQFKWEKKMIIFSMR